MAVCFWKKKSIWSKEEYLYEKREDGDMKCKNDVFFVNRILSLRCPFSNL